MSITRHNGKPLPRVWNTHPKAKVGDIVGEAEIRVSPYSRIRAKLLVFKSNAGMRRFFKNVLDNHTACKRTLGMCCPLTVEHIKFRKNKPDQMIWEVDPYFFCVVALIQGHLKMEIITHESVHAGFAYAARQNQKQWQKGDVLDEEEVCYPAGRIAYGINLFLHNEGLYEK